jgi:hypothetical protein
MSFVGRKSELIRQALAVALDGVAIDGRRAVGWVPYTGFVGGGCEPLYLRKAFGGMRQSVTLVYALPLSFN